MTRAVIQDLQIAVRALQSGDPANAMRACKRVLRKHPNNIDALMISGIASFQRDDLGSAAEALSRAVELAPTHADALNNLGIVLVRLGRNAEAVEILGRAANLRPKDAETRYNLGLTLQRQGSSERAAGRFREAAALRPGFAAAHTHLAQTLRDLGRFDEATVEIRRALAIRNDADAYLALSDIKRFEQDDDVRAMETLLASGRLGPRETTALSFALGKAYDDMGEYGRAFDMFELGNRLRHEMLGYDVAEDRSLFGRIRDVFDTAMVSNGRDGGCSSEIPVFIVGMPRSGTTLVEQILASHPEVHGGGEVEHLEKIVERIGPSFPEAVAGFSDEDLARLGTEYVGLLSADAQERGRVTDKLPANFRFVGFIHLILPRARIVHCTRDPVDTCLSCFQRNFGNRQRFAWDLGDLGHYYRLYDEIMAHWDAVLPGCMLSFRYEDLVADPETRVRELLSHCGLAWDARCLEFDRTRRAVSTASAGQVRQPLYATSVRRWRHYKDRLGPLLEALGPLAPVD